MNYTTFNIYEALFWLLLSGVTFTLYEFVHWHARAVFKEAAAWTLLFGVSDIIEVFTDGLLRADLWWLVLWKLICIVGIAHVIYKYLHLRMIIK